MKKRFFITVTYQATTMKSASVKVVVPVCWLSHRQRSGTRNLMACVLVLRLYAKRFLQLDVIGDTTTCRIHKCKGSDRQVRQLTQPVTLLLAIAIMSAKATSPRLLVNIIGTEAENLSMAQSKTPQKLQSTSHLPSLLFLMDHVPIKINASTSPLADARVHLPGVLSMAPMEPQTRPKQSTREG